MHRALIPAVAFAALLLASEAHAQITVSPQTSPALGTTIRGSSATTFSISTSGTVTRLTGNAIRLSTSSVTAPTVSINCGLLNLGGLCALRPMRVTIASAAAAPMSITKFRVANLSGTTWRTGSAPAEASVLVFELNAMGLLSTVSFSLGMDVVLAAGAASGAQTFPYTVTVQLL